MEDLDYKAVGEVSFVEKMRHSLSHVLAQAVLKLYPDTKLGIGPAISNGFYYDFEFSTPITEADLDKIEKIMREIVAKDIPIKQIMVDRETVINNYKSSEQIFKLDLLNNIVDDPLSFFVNGEREFADLCRGPHVESTGQIKAFKLDRIAGAYWRGDETRPMLTRIYGLAFETEKELSEYIEWRKEAERRDNRKLGPQLNLYFIDETAPGMPYWLPNGTVIINELLSFWRKEHAKRGYKETITPVLNKKALYETSGHWEHYRENMFIFEGEEDKDSETYCLKPMNCPNAMTIYKRDKHSYRELPLRLSDCDPIHRKEKTGELNGLLRVQRFEQDDAHIFLTPSQVRSEFREILDIAKQFYEIFGIEFRLRFGTRPENYMGELADWNSAESEILEVLKESGIDYFVMEGDGAFYGPKIDIVMKDVLGRDWQTGTVQLDYQIPKKFGLTYTDKDGSEKTPIVIHRVIYGSMERFVGILIEHYSGSFPLWISPIQVKLLTVSDSFVEYAKEVHSELLKAGVRVELDIRDEKLGSKIRDAEMLKVPYICVIGGKEKDNSAVSIRSKNKDLGLMGISEFLSGLSLEIESKGKTPLSGSGI